MTAPTDWVRFTTRVASLDHQARERSPRWYPHLRAALARVVAGVADPTTTRVDIAALLDAEQHRAAADRDLARGAWLDEKMIHLKALLLTADERRELRELGDRIGASMAAAQGLPA